MHTCNICKYAGRPIYKSPCSECKEFSEYEYENKKTNADRIRAMSDEELADVLREFAIKPISKGVVLYNHRVQTHDIDEEAMRCENNKNKG